MFGLVEEGKKKIYKNYQMIVYSKWKCNPLQCIPRRTLKRRIQKILSTIIREIKVSNSDVLHTDSSRQRTRCYDFQESGRSDITAFVWRVFLFFCWHSSGRERSKFQLERHNLPQKLFIRILFLLSFLFHLFFSFIVHCSSRTALGACLNSTVHSFEQEETLEAREEEEDVITIFTFVNTCKLKH